MTAEAEVAAALRSVAPPSVAVGALSIDARHEAGLHPVERAAVASAVAARRRELATGRALLRRLLDHDGAIAVGPAGAPVVPSGARASLAHDVELAVAAASRAPSVAALGIDVEPIVELDEDEAALVVRPDEATLDPLAAFVAKEATYKAWSALGGPMLDFGDVRVSVTGGRFEASVHDGASVFEGSLVGVAGRWIALVVA